MVKDIFLGLILGILNAGLVNYLSDVLPHTRRFSAPLCVHCGARLSWRQYLGMQTCPSCQAAPSRRRWIVWVLLPLIYLYLWLHPSADLMPYSGAIGCARAIGFVLLVFFGIVFIIDLEYRVVLDEVSLAGAALMTGLGTWLHNWQTTLIGGLAGYAFMYAIYGLGLLYVRWKNRRATVIDPDNVALGFGDVKLAGVLGLLLGWPDVLIMLLLGFLIGGLAGIVLIVKSLIQKQMDANLAMPYAPYLVLVSAYILLL